MKTLLALLVAAAGLAPAACRDTDAPAEAARPRAAEAPSSVAIPVKTSPVLRRAVTEVVAAPGHTASLAQQKIKTPFAGTLTELRVTDGDTVHAGEALGAVVSRDSEAALNGAREMERGARTDAEKADAARAVALAERGLVRATIVAPADGVVVSHAAVRGDRVAEDQEILTVADTAAFVFLADVPQSALARIRPGQGATVELAGRPERLAGAVHDVLPGANAADYTVPVRVDLRGLKAPPPLGLFGTARITVAGRPDAATVPEAALLRDDLTGVSRLAVVEHGRARWLDVTPGLKNDGSVEIRAPKLDAGTPVVVSGQVGLAEGAPVAVTP